MSLIPIIKNKLSNLSAPLYIDIINESGMHSVPKGSESHLKLILVSEVFEGKNLLNRQRIINEWLKEELANQIHALTMTLKTPSEWKQESRIATSPPCLGGSK